MHFRPGAACRFRFIPSLIQRIGLRVVRTKFLITQPKRTHPRLGVSFQPQPPFVSPHQLYLHMPTVFEPTLAQPQPPRIYTNPVNYSQQNHQAQENVNRPMPVTRPEGKQ